MIGFLVCLLVSLGGQNHGLLADRVDLIELNHLHDSIGKPTIDQVIFWEWSPEFRRFDVVAWRLVDGDVDRIPHQLPGGEWQVRWYDRQACRTREVRARIFRETWSTVDPERENKKYLDESFRAGLRVIRSSLKKKK